ncbi:MAG: DNA ligase [Campylobacteraceae bacterium 4484_4]|nr:MAG: DNA ligase [Campylobacteraceae bacterium 4484_4]
MRVTILLIFLLSSLFARPLSLQKPKSYRGDENITGWVMSEKLDGIRGYWDGKRLLTKNGHPIHAPKWFTHNFPPFALDGELWSGRGQFETTQSTVLDRTPSQKWQKITYQIFEVPNQKGDFFRRLERARSWFAAHPSRYARIIPQYPIKNRAHLKRFLEKIEKRGGEGVIVKDPHLAYFTGRSAHILKLKSAPDMEGRVIAINPGKGKFTGMMGSLTLRLEDGTIFRLGTGFTLDERKNPPPVGSLVTFRYRGFNKNHIPKFASYMRIRQRE